MYVFPIWMASPVREIESGVGPTIQSGSDAASRRVGASGEPHADKTTTPMVSSKQSWLNHPILVYSQAQLLRHKDLRDKDTCEISG